MGRFVLVCLALLLSSATCAASETAAPSAQSTQSTQPIRIGMSLGLTGRYAELARLKQFATRLWETGVNEKGGLLGRPVQVIIRDDKSDPELAKRIYEDLIVNDKVDAVLGPYSSPITAAVMPIAERNGFPMLAAGASSDELWKLGYKNLFGVSPPAGRYPMGFLAMLSEAEVQRIAIVTVDDQFSRALADGARRWATEYGLAVVDFSLLPKDKPDMEVAAKMARESGAQVLLLTGHYDESVKMRGALKKIRWAPVAYYASAGPGLQKYREVLGDAANGTFSTSIWEPHEELNLPGSQEFLIAYRTRYKEVPSYHSATAYAACQILEQAIVRAGTLERTALRNALASMDIKTLIGRYAVDRTGIQVKQFPLITQWQNGKREIVWPQELRTAKPLLSK